jgi:lysozyme
MEAQAIEAAEANAQRIASVAIQRYEPLRLLPHRVAADILMLGYRRNISRDGISQTEADVLLFNDVQTLMAQIRPQTFPLMNQLNDSRLAVVLHLAFMLGVQELQSLEPFWDAIRDNDFERAADEMMLSEWPERFENESDRRRALELVSMMRTGELRKPRVS